MNRISRFSLGLSAVLMAIPLSPYVRADFFIRDMRSDGSVQINSLARADALLSGVGALYESGAVRDFIDLFDAAANTGEGRGHFSNNQEFPGSTGVAGRDFAIQATASIIIDAAGTYTFGINSDDGARLRIDNGGGYVTVIEDSSVHAPRDSFGSITFDRAGTYLLDLVYFQRAGQATVELFAAQGSFTSFGQSSAWRLVGDTANGGLATWSAPTAVPEPSSLIAAGSAAVVLAGFALRRRRGV